MEQKHNSLGELRKKGEELMDLLDPHATERLREAIGDIAPDMVDYVLDFAYGRIMARPNLPLETRELCIIASLVALGTEHELKIHIRKALHIGVPKEHIVEVIIQQAVYSGFPKAINGLISAKEVFNEAGGAPED